MFGVSNLVSNVWQYTSVFEDVHTRAVILRGSSNYRPNGSIWYFPTVLELNKHNKYFLIDDSYERLGTVGFRCVADAADVCTQALCGTLRAAVSGNDLSQSDVQGWTTWGYQSGAGVDSMVGATVNISDVTTRPASRQQVCGGANSFVWVNGAPVGQVTQAESCGITAALGGALEFTVPLTSDRVVVEVFVSTMGGVGNFTAFISGGSSLARYTDTSLMSLDTVTGAVYQLRFSGVRPGQALHVSWQAVEGPQLQGAVSSPADVVDLTAVGSADWVHYGLNTSSSVDRKAGAGIIGAMAVVGPGPLLQYQNNPASFSWTDGTPHAVAPPSPTGVFVDGLGSGFTIDIECGVDPIVVRVYVGVYISQGRLNASLSDGSAPTFTDESLESSSGTVVGVYSLLVRAASPGQRLRVTWIQVKGSGNVTFQSVAVSKADPTMAAQLQGAAVRGIAPPSPANRR